MLESLPDYGNQKTAQVYTYIKENMSEINDINEWFEDIFSQETTYLYQLKDPILLAKYNNCRYKTGSLFEGIK